ncbi:hypothetical protein EN35_16090 [Rhodococcus qingshengii]|nr:hypothetical protein EN35_16090 [Rhodococcus qingshengii]
MSVTRSESCDTGFTTLPQAMVSWPMLSTGTFTVVRTARPTARNARIATSEHITPKKIRNSLRCLRLHHP